MKKKIFPLLCIFSLVLTVIASGVYYCVPKAYTIFVNGERIDNIYAYRCKGYTYFPLLCIIECLGYEVYFSENTNPEFIIDNTKYTVDIEKKEIHDGTKQYLGVSTGRLSIDIDDNDLYISKIEIKSFFNSAIKKSSFSVTVNNRKKHVYIEFEKENLNHIQND